MVSLHCLYSIWQTLYGVSRPRHAKFKDNPGFVLLESRIHFNMHIENVEVVTVLR